MVSHCHWNQKLIRDPNSSAADWEPLSDPSPPPPPPPPPPLHSLHPLSLSLSLSLSPGCLDRLFICPAWARKGYCDSKRKLMQKHCPSSCDFCYGKTRQQKAAAVQREKKKEKKNRKKVFSQLSSARSRCEPFANGATGANRSSQAEQRWGFSAICCGGEITLATGGVCVCRSGGYQHPRGGSVCFGSEFRPSRPGTCRLLAVSTPSIDSTSANWQLGPL